MRVFRTSFLVAVDPASAVENGEREEGRPLTLEEVKEYLRTALLLDWDREGQNDPIGIQSMEVDIEHLEELSATEVASHGSAQ
jgi:hypothetical protein